MYNYLVKTSDKKINLFVSFDDAAGFMDEKESEGLDSALYGGIFNPDGKDRSGFPPVLIMLTENLDWEYTIWFDT